MKQNRTQQLIIGIIAAAAALIVLVWVTVAALSGDSDNDSPTKEGLTSGATATSSPPLAKGEKPAGDIDSHRKALMAKAEKLLKASAKNSDAYGSYNKTIQALAKGDFSKLPKSYREQFRLVDYFQKDKQIEGAAYLATVNLGKYVNDLAKDSDSSIKPVNSDRWKNVFVDTEAGIGFVPVSNFVGGGSSFSLEFVYVDGEWIYTPYSFVDAVAAVSAATSNKSAE